MAARLNLIAQASCSRHQRHFDALLGAGCRTFDPGAKALVQRRKVPAAQRVAALPRSGTPMPWLESG